MIRSLRAVAFQSLQHALRTRVFLLVTAGTVLLLFTNMDGYGLLTAESAEGELRRMAQIRTSGAEDLLRLWVDSAALAGLFLGATAVSTDLRVGTLETVLTRPVPKSVYFLGRWLGVQALVLAFSGAGVVLSFTLLRLLLLDPRPLLWLGVAQLLVTAMLVTTLGMAFGARWHPVTAGIMALLLVTAPSLLQPLLDHPTLLLRWLARTVYFVGPAVPQEGQITEAFSQTPLDASYELSVLVILENTLYTVAALGLGCFLFQRREIRSPD